MKNARGGIFAPLALAIVLAADLTAGLGGIGLSSPPAPDGLASHAASMWQSASTALPFVEDFSDSTAAFHATLWPRVGSYYAAGVARPGPEAEDWADDPWRWGTRPLAGAVEAVWRQQSELAGGSARFGQGEGSTATYPASALSELVGPIIDLRGAQALPPTDARLLGGLDHTSNILLNSLATVPDAQRQGKDLVDGEAGMAVERLHSTAALRLMHQYGFDSAGAEFFDGARVEISANDGAQGWSPWTPLVPSSAVLRVGSDEMAGRRVVATSEGGSEARFRAEAPSASGGPKAEVAADPQGESADPVGLRADPLSRESVVDDRPEPLPPQPWEYTGLITSSESRDPGRGPWMGFGGTSNGWVESVFDLSIYAGSLIRLRFLISTAQPTSDEGPVVSPGFGWALDGLQVHALQPEDVQILGLAFPGTGAILPSGADFEPVLALQNPSTDPKSVRVTFSTPSGAQVRTATLGTGPLSRAFLPAGASYRSIGGASEGLGVLRASVSEIVANGQAGPASRSAAFHLLMADTEGWRVEKLEILPLTDEGAPDQDAGSLLKRGQDALVTATLAANGSRPLVLRLNGPDPDVVPRMLDPRGVHDGGFTPLQTEVRLPVSRSASGMAGSDAASQSVTWRWSGTQEAGSRQAAIVDADGATKARGSIVMVDAVPAPRMDADYANPWLYDGCLRSREFLGRVGVVTCEPGGELVSAAADVNALDTRRGNTLALFLASRGAAASARVWWLDDADPVGTPPAMGSAWQPISGHIPIPASSDWAQLRLDAGNLPEGGQGWVRIVFESGAGAWRIEAVRLEIHADDSAPDEAGVGLLSESFDVRAEPQAGFVSAASGTGFVWLTGRDDWTETIPPNETLPFPNQTVPVLNRTLSSPNGTLPFYDRGDVGWPTGVASLDGIVAGGKLSIRVPAGRMVEDSILEAPEPVLIDVARPRLEFRHWFDLAPGSTGYLEVRSGSAPQSGPGVPGGGDVAALAAAAEGWRVIARFNGSMVGREPIALEVPLDDLAGDTLRIRWRYHVGPSNDLSWGATGWLVEGVRLTGLDASGRDATVLTATPGFEGWTRKEALAVSSVHYASSYWTQGEPRPRALSFRPEQCAGENPVRYSKNERASAFVSEPLDLRFSIDPVLSVVHAGNFSAWSTSAGLRMSTLLDLEYQIQRADGSWPSQWTRASPNDPSTLDAVAQGALRDPRTGLPVGAPFSQIWPDGFAWPGSGGPQQGRSVFRFQQQEDQFGIAAALRGHIVRFRLAAWTQIPMALSLQAASGPCVEGAPPFQSPNLDWTIRAVRVYERRHLTDVAVTDIRLDFDDRDRLAAMDPRLVERAGGEGVILLSNDRGTITVDVANEGLLDVVAELAVSLTNRATGQRVPLRWIDDTSGQDVLRDVSIGVVPVGKDRTRPVRFLLDAQRAPPGEYGFLAATQLIAAVDTQPRNDVRGASMVLQPFRALGLDAASSRVRPFAAGPSTARVAEVAVRNDGNVDEGRVVVSGEIVRIEGLGTPVALQPPLLFPARDVPLGRRGGEAEVRWTMNGSEGAQLVPGERHAILVRVSPAAGSVTQWWLDGRPPFPEGTAPGALWNATRASAECGCFLIPFLVETTLFETDFSVNGTVAAIPGLRPRTEAALEASWTIRTLIDGVPADANRTDVPRWRLVGADEAADEVGGAASGRVWSLDAYSGREDVTHELLSPELPGHIIRAASRAVADLRYESTVDEDQATLEVRRKVGGQWMDWEPINGERSRRVAVVVPPDFPHVQGKDAAYGVAMPGHPAPPFYPSAEHRSRTAAIGAPWEWNPSKDHLFVTLERANAGSGPCSPSPAESRQLRLPAAEPEIRAFAEAVRVIAPYTCARVSLDKGANGTFEDVDDVGLPFENASSPRLVITFANTGRDDSWPGREACMPSSEAYVLPDDALAGRPFPQRVLSCVQLVASDAWHPAYVNPARATCWQPVVGRCRWTPFPMPNPGGEPSWKAALDETLSTLSEELGPSNVGLFTSLQPWTPLPVTRPPGAKFPVYTFNSPSGPIAMPIESLVDLAGRVDTYAGIVLLGDGVSPVYANRSLTLLRMSHGSTDLFNRAPHPALLKHDEDLMEILRHAPSAGVRIVATLGPASSLAALSGIARGTTATLWIPAPSLRDTWGSSEFRCTTADQPNLPSNWSKDQPYGPCLTGSNSMLVPDIEDDHNYLYFGAHDALALLQIDLLAAGGLSPALQRTVVTLTTPNLCGPAFGPGTTCRLAAPVVADRVDSTDPDSILLLSGRREEDVGLLLANLTQRLQPGPAFIPSSPGEWVGLPARLSFPTGGVFIRGSDGEQAFQGAPVQFRLRIRSEPAAGGHGAFHLDRFLLLGTPRVRDLGVDLVSPRPLESVAPGSPFTVVVEVQNRGRLSTLPSHAIVSIEQVVRPKDGACVAPPQEPVQVSIPTMAPGQILEIPLVPPQYPQPFFGGTMWAGTQCPLPWLQDSRFQLTVDHVQRTATTRWDEDRDNDLRTVEFLAREVDRIAFTELIVNPNEAPSSSHAIEIRAVISNEGTQAQRSRLDLVLAPARAFPCAEERRIRACDGTGAPVGIRWSRTESPLLARGESRTFSYFLEPEEEGIPAGIYVLTARASTSYPDNSPAPTETRSAMLRLRGPEDRPDGGAGSFSTGMSEVPDELPTRPAPGYGPWNPSGFMVAGAKTDGRYGPDGGTTHAGQPLFHGWRTVEACPECTDGRDRVIEWRRSELPSVDPTEDPPAWQHTEDEQPAAAMGQDDFGDDHLVWQPMEASDGGDGYLSLAAYEAATLELYHRFSATENTGFVVEMQLARRTNCGRDQLGFLRCSWVWNWTDGEQGWLPLRPAAGGETSALSRATETKLCSGGTVFPCPPRPWVTTRLRPSNPLGGLPGLWGGSSLSHEEADGWERARYPLIPGPEAAAERDRLADYCRRVRGVEPGETPPRENWNGNPQAPPLEACFRAPAEGNDGAAHQSGFVVRPVRFRFRAASHGGDVGESVWQIARISVGDHRLAFIGGPTERLSMLDNSVRFQPVRIENAGVAFDRVSVTWAPPPGRDLNPNVQVSLVRSPGQPSPGAILLDLPPGKGSVVWARVATNIPSLPAGSTVDFPFVVQARSLQDPFVDAEILVDGSMRTRAWGDLDVRGLVVDGNGDPASNLTAVEKVPIPVTVLLRNAGEAVLGSAQAPIVLRLTERRLLADGEVVSSRRVDQKGLTSPLEVFRKIGKDAFVTFEWTPPAIGIYELEAEANPLDPGGVLLPLPESDRSDNRLARAVMVGPVRLPDLHVVDAHLVPFALGCAAQRVERAIAGHTYCAVATLENRGNDAALPARGGENVSFVQFGIGASPPFSVPPMGHLVPGAVFPPGARVTVASSPWTAAMRADGNTSWRFYVDVTSASLFPSFANKSREFEVPVDRYALKVEPLSRAIPLAPGGSAAAYVNVTNKGTAPLTPRSNPVGSDAMRLEVGQAPTLLPGETARLRIAVTTSLGLGSDATIPTLVLTAREDPLLAVTVPLAFRLVAPSAVPAAYGLPGVGDSGDTLRFLLDNEGSADATHWSLLEVDAPLRTLGAWSLPVPPYARRAAEVPIGIDPLHAPGRFAANVTFEVFLGNDSVLVKARVPVDVPRAAALAADWERISSVAAPDAGAEILVRLRNTGNVPALARLLTRPDEVGAVDPVHADLQVLVAPGATVNVSIPVRSTASGVSTGETNITWGPADEPESPPMALSSSAWQVRFVSGRIRLVDAGLRPMGARGSLAEALVENLGDEAAPFEALVVRGGLVLARAEGDLAPAERRVVRLSIPSGGEPLAGAQFVVRPVGTSYRLQDERFHLVGDARSLAYAAPPGEGSRPGLLDEAGAYAAREALPLAAIAVSTLALLGVAFVVFRRLRR